MLSGVRRQIMFGNAVMQDTSGRWLYQIILMTDFGSGILESLKQNLTWCVMRMVCWLVQISNHMLWQSHMCFFCTLRNYSLNVFRLMFMCLFSCQIEGIHFHAHLMILCTSWCLHYFFWQILHLICFICDKVHSSRFFIGIYGSMKNI